MYNELFYLDGNANATSVVNSNKVDYDLGVDVSIA